MRGALLSVVCGLVGACSVTSDLDSYLGSSAMGRDAAGIADVGNPWPDAGGGNSGQGSGGQVGMDGYLSDAVAGSGGASAPDASACPCPAGQMCCNGACAQCCSAADCTPEPSNCRVAQCMAGACKLLDSCAKGQVCCSAQCKSGVSCYQDSDKDGWGTGNPIQGCGGCPPGQASQPGDCCDTDPEAYPGAKGSEKPNLCGSFDYDCDGQATKTLTGPYSAGCFGSSCLECKNGNLGSGSNVACGQSANAYTCAGSCPCGSNFTVYVQSCH